MSIEVRLIGSLLSRLASRITNPLDYNNPAVEVWILATGEWNDNGVWMDDKNWID